MELLTKPFIVVYDKDKNIIIRQTQNKQTYVGKGNKYAEFLTEEDLNKFIIDHQLKEMDSI